MTEQSGHEQAEHDEEQPRGTFLLMLLFLLGIAMTFAWTYFTLIEQS